MQMDSHNEVVSAHHYYAYYTHRKNFNNYESLYRTKVDPMLVISLLHCSRLYTYICHSSI